VSHDALNQELFAEHTRTVQNLKHADPDKYWSVSEPGREYQSHRVPGGFVGIADHGSSIDVGGLVARPGAKGVAAAAMRTADEKYSQHPQTLDAFDGHLPKIYAKHGFRETGRLPFDPQYAPPQWNEAKHGRPDVVLMARPAAQGSLFGEQFPTTPPPAPKKAPRRATRGRGPGQPTLPGL
jgi:hypothetical protein